MVVADEDTDSVEVVATVCVRRAEADAEDRAEPDAVCVGDPVPEPEPEPEGDCDAAADAEAVEVRVPEPVADALADGTGVEDGGPSGGGLYTHTASAPGVQLVCTSHRGGVHTLHGVHAGDPSVANAPAAPGK